MSVENPSRRQWLAGLAGLLCACVWPSQRTADSVRATGLERARSTSAAGRRVTSYSDGVHNATLGTITSYRYDSHGRLVNAETKG